MRLAKASASSVFEDIAVDCEEGLPDSKLFTVKLIFPFAGKPYRRDEVVESLEHVGFQASDLMAVRPLEDNSKWLVTFYRKECVVRALASTFAIRGNTARVFSMTKDILSLRIHWLPVYVPMAHVAIVLSKFGVVQSLGWHYSRIKGYEDVRSSVRQVVLEVDPKFSLPSIERLHFDNETYRFLITVPGRGPVCFRCDAVGHTRKECNAPYCRHCNTFTHSSEECVVRKCDTDAQKEGEKDEGKNNGQDGSLSMETGIGSAKDDDGGAVKGSEGSGTDKVEAGGSADSCVGSSGKATETVQDSQEGVSTEGVSTGDTLFAMVKDVEPELFNTASDDGDADMSSDSTSVKGQQVKKRRLRRK